MSTLADKLPTLSDADLKSLRANAERVAQRDAGVQSATAAEIIPLIDLEFERRAGLRGLDENQKVSYEIETDRRSGKSSAGQLKTEG